MTTNKPRAAIVALAITVGFIIFQVGADWARGVGALLALLGLVVALGAVATLSYDNMVTNRLDASPGAVPQPAIARLLFQDTRSAPPGLEAARSSRASGRASPQSRRPRPSRRSPTSGTATSCNSCSIS